MKEGFAKSSENGHCISGEFDMKHKTISFLLNMII